MIQSLLLIALLQCAPDMLHKTRGRQAPLHSTASFIADAAWTCSMLTALPPTCQWSEVLHEKRPQAQCQDWIKNQEALHPEDVIFLVCEDELILCGWVWMRVYAQDDMQV